MADKDETTNEGRLIEGLDLTDREAEDLLKDGDEQNTADNDNNNGESEKDTTDWKSEAAKWKSLSRQNEKSFKDNAAKLKKYEDANKSELERLTEDRDQTRAEAARAKAQANALSAAIERAPDWATPAIIKKIAKRARGDSDDELAEDIDDLYEMAAPKGTPPPKTPGKPKERLKGGAEPDEEVEETDGRKLAARIPRSAII